MLNKICHYLKILVEYFLKLPSRIPLFICTVLLVMDIHYPVTQFTIQPPPSIFNKINCQHVVRQYLNIAISYEIPVQIYTHTPIKMHTYPAYIIQSSAINASMYIIVHVNCWQRETFFQQFASSVCPKPVLTEFFYMWFQSNLAVIFNELVRHTLENEKQRKYHCWAKIKLKINHPLRINNTVATRTVLLPNNKT